MNQNESKVIVERANELNNSIINLEVLIARKQDEIDRSKKEISDLEERLLTTRGAFTLAMEFARTFNLVEEEMQKLEEVTPDSENNGEIETLPSNVESE